MRKIPVYYYSSSSNLTGRFAEALARIDGRRVLNLARSEVRRSEPTGPWVLLTPSYKAGNAAEVTLPAGVRAFLRSPMTRRRMVGIIGSGNRNFGEYYQAAARDLSQRSGRPVLFERAGGKPGIGDRLGDGVHCGSTGLDECRGFGRCAVVADDAMPGANRVDRHRTAHHAESDERDGCHEGAPP